MLHVWRPKTRIIPFGNYPASPELTRTQRMFVEWNAERMQISPEESLQRYLASWQCLPQGHAGYDYREFCGLSHDVFKVFYRDSPAEVHEAYKFHARLHFLRILSYREYDFVTESVIPWLLGKAPAVILDYGCGLAQSAFSLVERLESNGGKAKLVLVDIPTLMKDFLVWTGKRLSIPLEFIDCDISTPYPVLPRCDICIATSVFEHIHDPVRAFVNMDNALAPGGYLISNIGDQSAEFFHVSPQLAVLRDQITTRGYVTIAPDIFRKPDQPVW